MAKENQKLMNIRVSEKKMPTWEIKKFVETNKPVETVKYNIETFKEGVKSLINFARNNPTYAYRLVKIEIDFIKITASKDE